MRGRMSQTAEVIWGIRLAMISSCESINPRSACMGVERYRGIFFTTTTETAEPTRNCRSSPYHSKTPSIPTSVDLLRYDTRSISYVWGVKVLDSSIDSAAFSRVKALGTQQHTRYRLFHRLEILAGWDIMLYQMFLNAHILHSSPLPPRTGPNITYTGCFKRV